MASTATGIPTVNEDLILKKLHDVTTSERADELVAKLSEVKINAEGTLEKYLSKSKWVVLKAILKSGKCKQETCCQVKFENKTLVERAILEKQWDFLDDCLDHKCLQHVKLGNRAYNFIEKAEINITHRMKKKIESWDKKRLFLALMSREEMDGAKACIGWMNDRNYTLDGKVSSVNYW